MLELETLISLFRSHLPNATIERTPESNLIINGRLFVTDNLRRIIASDTSRTPSTHISEFISAMFPLHSNPCVFPPLSLARTRILPRLKPDSELELLDSCAIPYTPFSNSTHLLYLVDYPNATASLPSSQLALWNLSLSDLHDLAISNLSQLPLTFELVTSSVGRGTACVFTDHDGHDAARLLHPHLHSTLSSQLGPSFYCAVPSRDTFVCFSGESSFLSRLSTRIALDFTRLPYPISPSFFLCTPDGISGSCYP